MEMTMINQKSTTWTLLLVALFALALPFVSMIDVSADNKNSSIPEVTVDVNKGGGISFSGDSAFKESGSNAWNTLLTKYRGVIVGVSGIAAITMVLVFISNFVRLGAASGNPAQRSAATVGLLWSGIAAAGLGAVSLIVGIFYNAIS